jgi:hypothetical protein
MSEQRPSEVDLERELGELGPLMAEQGAAEAQLSSQFAARLRTGLADPGSLTPDPDFASRLRNRLAGRPSARPVSRDGRRRLFAPAFTAAALLAVIAALVVFGNQPHSPAPAFQPPYPRVSDLTFGYPALPSRAGGLSATTSLVHPGHGSAYGGRLRFRAASIQSGVSSSFAYKLESPPDPARLRKLLDIPATLRHVEQGGNKWLVAATGGEGRKPLHSIAVSSTAGEVVYHDRRNFVLPRSSRRLSVSRAVSVARAWLGKLGWPSGRMPVISVHPLQKRQKVQRVVLSWAGVRAASTPAATLWITPNRSVIEGLLWPSVAQQTRLVLRPVADAWKEVSSHKIPSAVLGISPRAHLPGVVHVAKTRVVALLTFGKSGSLYLVPSYRFGGFVKLRGLTRQHAWLGLAPGTRK